MPEYKKRFDLEERTAKFGEGAIALCKTITQDAVSKPLISQFIRSATSVGANYMEANNASSRRDFRNKIYICKKEAQETKHWLRMLAVHTRDHNDARNALHREAQELTLIFGKIVSSLDHSSLIRH